MFSRSPLIALVSLACIGAAFACSAQGDQTDTGLNDDGNGGNGAGGTLPVGGTSSTSGTGGTIPVSGTGAGAAAGTGGTQGGVMCAGNGARLKGVLREFQPTWMGQAGHPDFEPQVSKAPGNEAGWINMYFNRIETGIVQQRISDDINRKPVYAGPAAGTPTTMGPDYFPSWFIDDPRINLSID